jgi:Raf kinase inhibitor-like YbhB/YbcL family protein
MRKVMARSWVLSSLILGIILLHNPTSSGLSYFYKSGETEMKLYSTAFENGGMIPEKYTCDEANVSPPLSWEGVPEKSKGLALICDDPDAPMGTWVHWVIYSIPPQQKGFSENIPAEKNLSTGAVQGVNDFGHLGYGGPCPPGGTHRYFFKLYALDTVIHLTPGATKAQLLKVIQGHILEETQLLGKYKRS